MKEWKKIRLKTNIKDKGHSNLRRDLNEFANICGLPDCSQNDFDRHVEVMVEMYFKE